MVRYFSALALIICTLSANARDTVVLCEKSNDHASSRDFDKALDDLNSKGYNLREIGRKVKKSTMTYVGTGLRLGALSDRKAFIMGSVAGTPARETEFFDKRPYSITSIDGVSSVDMDIEEARKLIIGNGKAETGVVLELAPLSVEPGEGRSYTRYIVRKRIVIPVVTTCYTIGLTKK